MRKFTVGYVQSGQKLKGHPDSKMVGNLKLPNILRQIFGVVEMGKKTRDFLVKKNKIRNNDFVHETKLIINCFLLQQNGILENMKGRMPQRTLRLVGGGNRLIKGLLIKEMLQ